MKPGAMRKGTVQARIAAFEFTANVPKVKNHRSFSSSGQVSKMISFFETNKAGEMPVGSSSPQVSKKVIKLASIFGPVVGFGDIEKGTGENFPISDGISEMKNEDLNRQFSLMTTTSAQPSSPQGERDSEFDKSSKTNDYVVSLDKSTSTKLSVTKQDGKSQTQELEKKEEAMNATLLCVEPETVKSTGLHNEKSAMKTFPEIFAENSKASLAKEAECKPFDSYRGLTESTAVDEIQPSTDNCEEPVKGNAGEKTITSKKLQANIGRKKILKIRTKDENAKLPASRETNPSTEGRTGRRKVFRRPRNERNSSVRKTLVRGLRALKQKLSRQAVSTETLETNQSATQCTTCMITIESTSPINVSCKA